MKQSLFILAAIFIGIVFPQGHAYTHLIRYSLIIMLFLAFLGVDFNFKQITRLHLYIILANVTIPMVLYVVLYPFGVTYALIGFTLGIAPAAAASPVLAQFMKTDVAFVTTAVLLANPLAAICIPLALPFLLQVDTAISISDVLTPVLIVVGAPLVLSLLITRISKRATAFFIRHKKVSFLLFLFNVWVGSGKATHFIWYEQGQELQQLVFIFICTGCICLLNFSIGERLMPSHMRLAGGLSLGRKNTMFALWVALTFIGPLVALGPIFYILFQNGYNSYQLLQLERKSSSGPSS